MSTPCSDAARALVSGLGVVGDDPAIEVLVRAVGEGQRATTREDVRTALLVLAEGLELDDPAAAGVAARVLGAMVEAGHDAAPMRPLVAGFLQRVLPRCAALSDAARDAVGEPPEDEEDPAAWLAERRDPAFAAAAAQLPDAAAAWWRLASTWPGLVAVLCSDPAARADARPLLADAERLRGAHEAGGWLVALLNVLDGEPFVAIEPLTRSAIGGRMSGVVECFQLAILLMDAFPGEHRLAPRRVSKAVAGVARGEGPQSTRYPVTATWDLHGYAALGPDGLLAGAGAPIALEEMPAAIPVLDGHRVVVLAPPAQERTWRAGRMFAALPASLDGVRALDRGGVAGWLERIAAAAGDGAE